MIRRWGLCIGLSALALLAPMSAAAQGVFPNQQPLVVPEPETEREETRTEPLELPPLDELSPDRQSPIAAGLRVFVAAFAVTGATAFSAEEISAVLAPFTGRVISSEELLAARDALTHLYVSHGYITSGAIIPDQDVENDVVTLAVVEGRLAEIEVTGQSRFRPGYFERRLRHAGRAPVSVERIESQLQLFQLDPLIARVQASLEPGARPGESRLVVRVEETRPYHVAVGTADDRSPAVGSTGGILWTDVANLVGEGDVLAVRSEVTGGLWEVNARYEIPVTRFDTRLGLHYRVTHSKVIEDPFDELDIRAQSQTLGFSVYQPVYRSSMNDVRVGLVFEWRESEATLLGAPFCFQTETSVCDPVVVPLRLAAEWTLRSPRDVVAARSLVSFGLDTLGATVTDAGPDAKFVAWLGQMQWVHVLPESLRGSEFVARTSMQVANKPLFAIERFSIGGFNTVRSYRENQLVTDNGVSGSVELRVPIWRDALGRHRLQLVPFIDAGHAWDNDNEAPPEENLASVGIGFRAWPTNWATAEFFWGYRIVDVPNPKRDAQDYGIQFQVVLDVF